MALKPGPKELQILQESRIVGNGITKALPRIPQV